MKRSSLFLLPLLGVFSFFVSCHPEEKQEPASDDKIVVTNVIVPSNYETDPGATLTISLRGKTGMLSSDKIVLRDASSKEYVMPLASVDDGKSFSFALADGIKTGRYGLYIEHGGKRWFCGSIELSVVKRVVIEPEAGMTVYGQVECDGTGVPNVVVSDGVEVVRTDADGIYQMKSAKRHKYVFVSIPSGYEVPSEGIMPTFHRQLVQPAGVAERADFSLVRADGQENHTMLFFGDIHLANRTGDRTQFQDFVKDVNATVAAHAGKRIYALTLGDMTWDLYWKDNKYSYKEYIADANGIKNLQIFHTIGNHDHSMYYTGDFDTVTEYKQVMAPTYYSFNVGNIHYIVLDNIECTNATVNTDRSDGAYNRTYKDYVVQEQLDWLKKDLAFVSTSTPLCLTMHAPLFTYLGASSLDDANALVNILKSYDQVQFFTGHTHKMYNIDNSGTTHVFEHNAGAVCATWWWSANQTPGIHIAQDGAPGGYSIVDVTGNTFKWKFKGTGRDINHQFRSYDRNQIALTAETWTPSASSANITSWNSYAKDWSATSTANYVYINVWNYDPSWKVEVTENGRALSVTRVTIKDPLHLIAYTAKRLNANKSNSFPTSDNNHTFRVQASSPTSTLEIKVTDRFGNVYTESMTRPKNFNASVYK